MKRFLAILILVFEVIIVTLILTSGSTIKVEPEVQTPEKLPLVIETEDYKFQKFKDNIRWDWKDEEYLLKIAMFHGGSLEEKAYTILVTLNKVRENGESILDTTLKELYDIDGITAYDYDS